jgi:carbohydrate diacid regulator
MDYIITEPKLSNDLYIATQSGSDNVLKKMNRKHNVEKLKKIIFYSDKIIVPYNNLGIGRLIYQLPLPLCKMFMTEIFGDQIPNFDEETMMTINKFFENNLNVSETSRQLYVHRNTLVYRLEKLQKATGLDIRVFDDAMTFKIAMMVVNYMKNMENKEV